MTVVDYLVVRRVITVARTGLYVLTCEYGWERDHEIYNLKLSMEDLREAYANSI